MAKSFKEIINEQPQDVTGDGVIDNKDILSLLELINPKTQLEIGVTSLLIVAAENDLIPKTMFEAVFDLIETLPEESLTDEVPEEEEDVNEECDILNEAVPLFKRKGFVKCPNGLIRKRGNCGKVKDKKRSKILKRAAKKAANKISRKKGAIKTKRTKRRLGQ